VEELPKTKAAMKQIMHPLTKHLQVLFFAPGLSFVSEKGMN
jgi:hypothetical protein